MRGNRLLACSEIQLYLAIQYPVDTVYVKITSKIVFLLINVYIASYVSSVLRVDGNHRRKDKVLEFTHRK